MQAKKLLLVLGTSVVMAACGGGGGDDGPRADAPTATGPDATAAFASVDGFIAFVQQLVASNSETAEPVALPARAAPTSETM